jgi:hypothetical protein
MFTFTSKSFSLKKYLKRGFKSFKKKPEKYCNKIQFFFTDIFTQDFLQTEVSDENHHKKSGILHKNYLPKRGKKQEIGHEALKLALTSALVCS